MEGKLDWVHACRLPRTIGRPKSSTIWRGNRVSNVENDSKMALCWKPRWSNAKAVKDLSTRSLVDERSTLQEATRFPLLHNSLPYELFLGLQGFVFQQNKSRRCNCALNLLTHFCSDPPHVTFHVKYVEIWSILKNQLWKLPHAIATGRLLSFPEAWGASGWHFKWLPPFKASNCHILGPCAPLLK